MYVPWSAPSGWPIVDEGLLMAGIDGMLFVHAGVHVTDAVYARYLAEMARSIDERDLGNRVGVVYDALGGVDVDARRRQQLAGILASRRAKMAATTAAFALVTDSAVMRGVLRAVFWLAPPPYPWAVASNLRSGLEYTRAEAPRAEVDRILRAYQRLKDEALGSASRPGRARGGRVGAVTPPEG